jgi:hypothetical protein
MKRLLAIIACVLAASAATVSCGGSADGAADKMTIVGAGS